MPPTTEESSAPSGLGGASTEANYQLPWTAIPRFIPGTTDVTEYAKKLQFLAAMWPKESIALLAPRAALLCEGTAFKKVSSLPADKLKSSDDSGVRLLVTTLGGAWGRSEVELKYDVFEKAIFGTIQKSDESNDSYLARHDVHFEELLAQGVSFEEIRAYILLRQSALSAEDRKKIVVEMSGDAGNEDSERAYNASAAPGAGDDNDYELDPEYVEAMAAMDDQDALAVASFEEELEGFFQDTPEMQEALVSYLEAATTVAEVDPGPAAAFLAGHFDESRDLEVLTQLPEEAVSLAEAAPSVPTSQAEIGLSLGARFARLTESGPRYTPTEARTVPMSELGQTIVTFGKHAKGRTFEDVIVNEESWIKWVCDHLGTSDKTEHQVLLIYIERYVAEAEVLEADLRQTTEAVTVQPTPKSKMPPRKPSRIQEPPVEDHWDMVAEAELQNAMESQVQALRVPGSNTSDEDLTPHALTEGRWHGPAKVICSEGKSIVWVAHGTTIIRSDVLSPAPAVVPEPIPNTVGPSNLPTATPADDIGQPEQELTPQETGIIDEDGDALVQFSTVVDLKPKEVKRTRAEVSLKHLSSKEVALFEQAKLKEINCWVQTSAIRGILRRKLNPEQILKSRWILTWKAPEEGETQQRAKARLVVLGYQDPKLVEVSRDAPTLSKEGRSIILQTLASRRFQLSDSVFKSKIDELQKSLPFGSRKFDSFTFTGIHLQQHADGSIKASQGDYVRSIPAIDVGRLRRQNLETRANESEQSKLRGLIGSLQYAVTHSRPDMAAKLGEIQSQTACPTIQTLMSANKVLREAQETSSVSIRYLPIPVSQVTFVSFGDASFASARNLSSHQGALICATDENLNRNQEAPVSPVAWSSKKIPRVVRSTLSAEAYAMSKAVDILGWIRALWGVIHIPHFKWQ
ncbi:GIP, partial [Symbiodinium necroappetens]